MVYVVATQRQQVHVACIIGVILTLVWLVKNERTIQWSPSTQMVSSFCKYNVFLGVQDSALKARIKMKFKQ